MGRKSIYGHRVSLHMKISPDVLGKLRKHCAKLRISLNRGADDLLRKMLSPSVAESPIRKGAKHDE